MQNLQNLKDKMAKMKIAIEDGALALDVAQSQADFWEKKAKALSSSWNPLAEIAIGIAYALMGRGDEAQEILEYLTEQSKKEYVPPSYLAALSFSLGDTDQGFEWLDKSYEDRDYFLTLFMWMPLLDIFGLRSDPRYKALLKKMNLEP